jgi:yeast amino acid transporter
MEKDTDASKRKNDSLSPGPNYPVNPVYGNSKRVKASWARQVTDSFKRDPNARVTKASHTEGHRNVFDLEAAAANTANSPLHRRLKGRHIQMIAIGGSIGMLLTSHGFAGHSSILFS